MKRASFRGSNGPTYGLVTGSERIDLGKRLGSRYPDLNGEE